ncbi:hypothetical protein Fmac_021564 [Flemingia macrophylla]|uniref:Spastin/Vps4 C-terminal domain-containing protein n=1 Tax=Flemingia macrophylla TaxID=520843 RepID=A0ABD1LX87_9FABA
MCRQKQLWEHFEELIESLFELMKIRVSTPWSTSRRISSRRRTLRSRKPSRRNSPSTSAASRRFAARPKTKPKDSGGNSEDPEQAKLRVGFNSTIKREKPNVKWTNIMRLESTKQALQEAVILPVKFPQFFTGGLDVLFEPVRKTQDAMFFFKNPEGMWIPCGPKQKGAVPTTRCRSLLQKDWLLILPPPITRTDFDKVLARQRPTISKRIRREETFRFLLLLFSFLSSPIFA